MLKVKQELDFNAKTKAMLEKWFIIQQNSIASVKYSLDFCVRHSHMNVSEIPTTVLERNVIALCKKIYTIGQYQQCINSFFRAGPHSSMSSFELQNKENQKEIEKIKKVLFALIIIIQDKIKKLSLKMHYSALFCSQLEKNKLKNNSVRGVKPYEI